MLYVYGDIYIRYYAMSTMASAPQRAIVITRRYILLLPYESML